MKADRAEWAAALAPALLLAALLAGLAGLLMASTDPFERQALLSLLQPRLALLLMLWFFLSLAGGVLARWAWQRFGQAPGRLAERVQVLLAAAPGATFDCPTVESGAGAQALTQAVQALVQQRDELRADITARVAQASQQVEQERQRLAALMAELQHSVVVCNADGRVLLFNQRAQGLFRSLLEVNDVHTALSGNVEALALGRSIYAVLDRHLVGHALQAVQQGLLRGVVQPSAQFVTSTAGGQLLRVQLAAVRAADGALDGGMAQPLAGTAQPLAGFVLLLDNITAEMAQHSARAAQLHSLTEGSRAALCNLQAALELLDDPALTEHQRGRFLGVIRDEVAGLVQRLNQTPAVDAAGNSPWPLEDMQGADLLAAAAIRLLASVDSVDPALWLRVDSFLLLQALQFLAEQGLRADGPIAPLSLRLAVSGGHGQLDLVCADPLGQRQAAPGWDRLPIVLGDQRSSLSVAEVLQRHAGTVWFERDRLQQQVFFRLLLPLASANQTDSAALATPPPEPSDSRPEFYDFDLFAQPQPYANSASSASSASATNRREQNLADLNYTVFDTETTGLAPSAGDQIIQIGATRINAGKLRRQQCFEQLVDPGRVMSAANQAIHGIEPRMLHGQPTIAVVLPAFFVFAEDSVLVAHNAAFDMRFLQMQEANTGLVFDQPVLDTMLLSAVIHPQQSSHRLEAICQRLGVPLLGRHTALGDALVTAEVFLKMLPLLRSMGIQTLAQALAASQKTQLARLTY